MGTPILRIVYEDSGPPVYERVEIRRDGSVVTSFDSGDPIIDWVDAWKWLSENAKGPVLHSSSVDHFFMDGAPYTNLYVDHENENASFTTKQVIDGNVDVEEMAEYIINDDIQTFEELKAYYKANKKVAKKVKKKVKKKIGGVRCSKKKKR